MHHLVANGDDVQLVPVVRLVDAIHFRRFTNGRQQPTSVARLRPHDLPLPGNNPATGRLLVELPGVAIAGVEVVLCAPHVPLRFAFSRRRRPACGAARAWTGLARPPGSYSLTRR